MDSRYQRHVGGHGMAVTHIRDNFLFARNSHGNRNPIIEYTKDIIEAGLIDGTIKLFSFDLVTNPELFPSDEYIENHPNVFKTPDNTAGISRYPGEPMSQQLQEIRYQSMREQGSGESSMNPVPSAVPRPEDESTAVSYQDQEFSPIGDNNEPEFTSPNDLGIFNQLNFNLPQDFAMQSVSDAQIKAALKEVFPNLASGDSSNEKAEYSDY